MPVFRGVIPIFTFQQSDGLFVPLAERHKNEPRTQNVDIIFIIFIIIILIILIIIEDFMWWKPDKNRIRGRRFVPGIYKCVRQWTVRCSWCDTQSANARAIGLLPLGYHYRYRYPHSPLFFPRWKQVNPTARSFINSAYAMRKKKCIIKQL